MVEKQTEKTENFRIVQKSKKEFNIQRLFIVKETTTGLFRKDKTVTKEVWKYIDAYGYTLNTLFFNPVQFTTKEEADEFSRSLCDYPIYTNVENKSKTEKSKTNKHAFKKIFEQTARDGMVEYNHVEFITTHKTLYSCIIQAMENAVILTEQPIQETEPESVFNDLWRKTVEGNPTKNYVDCIMIAMEKAFELGSVSPQEQIDSRPTCSMAGNGFCPFEINGGQCALVGECKNKI